MELLFRREQKTSGISKSNFKLWSKLELTEDEQEIVKRYSFDETTLIETIQPTLLRNTILAAIVFFFVGWAVTYGVLGTNFSSLGAVIGAAVGAYWYYHQKRETIYVKDLLHGRFFTCESVVDLAKKEGHLEQTTAILRQVMESAKHWDGTARQTIDPLPKEEALALVKSL